MIATVTADQKTLQLVAKPQFNKTRVESCVGAVREPPEIRALLEAPLPWASTNGGFATGSSEFRREQKHGAISCASPTTKARGLLHAENWQTTRQDH